MHTGDNIFISLGVFVTPFDATLFSSVPGVRCCDCPGCDLTMPTLLIDGTTSSYANLTDATAALADQAATGCLAEGMATTSAYTRGTLHSDFTSGTFTITTLMNQSDAGGTTSQDAVTARMYLTAAGGLSCIYDLNATGAGSPAAGNFVVALYEDDQTSVVGSTGLNSSPISGTFTPTISRDGYYWLYATPTQTFDTPGTGTATISLISTGTDMNPCTVKAAYGSTPDYLVCA